MQQNNRKYKQTPIGLIPTDWKVKKFGEVVKIEGGNQPSLKNFIYEHKEGYIRLIQTRDYRTDKYITYIPKVLAKKFCKKDDIIIGRYGPPIFQIFTGLEGAYNVALMKAIPDLSIADRKFTYYFISRPELRKYLEGLSQRSGGQTGVEIDKLNDYPFPIPPLPEQQKIAEILSAWDKAIQETGLLLKKLEVRNKALAFSLLTGKKRVKGFEGKEFKKSFANQVFKSVSIKNNTENVELLSATQENGIIPRSLLETRVTMPSGSLNTYKLVQKGDFVISLRSFQGGIEYSKYTGVVSPAYTVLKPTNPINDDFYKYYFKSKDLIGRLSVAVIGIRDGKNISYDDFSTIILPNPSLEEQTAIAEVLNTAQQELKQYQEKLKALQQQKKGLMQQLLTGKIRTV